MNQIETTQWCNQNGISFEPFTPDTYAQNGDAERFGRLIMEKARAICLLVNLPHTLLRKIVSKATYPYNLTPGMSNDCKSLYESFHSYVFDKKEVSNLQKLLLYHLIRFGWKAYILIKSKGDLHYRQKSRKLDAKAYISFLVSYKSTNIHRI